MTLYQFDESAGEVVDSALIGVQPDYGILTDGTPRVESPFWNQAGRKAIRLEAAKKQSVVAGHSVDLEHSKGVSISLLFLNLHELNDAAFHGILAKGSEEDGAVNDSRINYGLRFNLKQDALQVWLNDGSGLRGAKFTARKILGERRRVHLTATIETTDAPDADEDSVEDDLRIRLFVNGRPAEPTGAAGGSVTGSDVWLTDTKLEDCTGEGPLRIGSSTATAEFTSGVVDCLAVFPRALSPAEAARLFIEVAGADAARLAEQEVRPAPKPPRLAGLSQRGLQTGMTTRLTIHGGNLTPGAIVVLPIPGLVQRILPDAKPGQVTAELTLPEGTLSGFYPLRVQTAHGISNAVAIAVDELPEQKYASLKAGEPVVLPVACSGKLAGASRATISFRGRAGQRIVADVEARRLGSQMDPVLEIKTSRGTPLEIQWGRPLLGGDARAEIEIPADGVYLAELHDLSFQAPAGSDFRLKLGELKLVDAVFPPVVGPGRDTLVELIGPGIASGTLVRVHASQGEGDYAVPVSLPRALGVTGAAPSLSCTGEVQLVEAPPIGGGMQLADARFSESNRQPCRIAGRISAPGEEDRFLLHVTPGQKLHFAVHARSSGSPLDAFLAVCEHPSGKVLAVGSDSAETRDPTLDFTIPKKTAQIQVAVRDLHNQGSKTHFYGLWVAPADFPRFSLRLETSQVNLPAGGTAVVRLQVERQNYRGPIKLSVQGSENVSITPQRVKPGNGTVTVLVTLSHNGERPLSDLAEMTVVGETVETSPIVRGVARTAFEPTSRPAAGVNTGLATALTDRFDRRVAIKTLPERLFQGIPAEIDLEFAGAVPDQIEGVVRLSLMSTEQPRPGRSFLQPNAGNKPLIRTAPEQAVSMETEAAKLKIAVPEDVAERRISFVVRGEVVPHRYSKNVLRTFYSDPFQLPVTVPATVEFSYDALELVKGSLTRFQGRITRDKSFQGGIEIELTRLPDGCSAPSVTLLPGQEEFELVISASKEATVPQLPFVLLNVKAAGGGPVQPPRIIAVRLLASPEETSTNE